MSKKRTLSPAQDKAANPQENVWVQANAGTGKTSVLVQRLLRILFRTQDLSNSGILCLTYTNAGAGEMRNRILASLRDWAKASDKELIDLLSGVSINTVPDEKDLRHARQIFFEYIDNPEILKIKTIHGFCEEILHRFPMEAGISPGWSLISDANQRTLLQDAFNRLINKSNRKEIKDAFSYIVTRVSETYMQDLLNILSAQYKYFFQIDNVYNYRQYFIDNIKNFLQLNTDKNLDTTTEKLEKIVQIAEQDINSSKTPAKYLIKIINYTKQYIDKTINFEFYKDAYLNADGTKNSNVAKKEYLTAEQERVYQINQQNIAQTIFNDTMAIFDLSAEFAKTYHQIKSERNVLDFEDLILYTRKLFSTPKSMGWVLSQLNIRLGHILVDEAQDTSPMQWDILKMLSCDFFTEGDTDNLPHSLFVVGDTKQSIYGFQGADPDAFATSRQAISAQIKQNMRTIQEIPLEQSFRSLSPILNTVDTFFDNKQIIQATGFTNNKHTAFRTDGSGKVEIHKLISKQNDNQTVQDYIKIIADKIQSLLLSGKYKAHDIMVLVQNRKPMTEPLIKELKKRQIDVAGNDRIVLPTFPAIRDFLNLIRFCLNQDDDYSLCCVLKSPFFRLKEQDIFKICKIKNDTNYTNQQQNTHQKLTTVFETLQDTYPNIYTELQDWIDTAKVSGPYSFFSYLLNQRKMRKEFIGTLGNQIIDPLEEFMTICLSYERTQTGTLKHFLKWFITGASEIKRDMDASAGVRIVTVHGSKGLEAKVIFLIDTVRMPTLEKILPIPSQDNQSMPTPLWIWLSKTDNGCACNEAVNALSDSKIAEYYRLLYVAMTRARDELYIYGYTPHKNAPEMSWHSQLWSVLSDAQIATKSEDIIRITNEQ